MNRHQNQIKNDDCNKYQRLYDEYLKFDGNFDKIKDMFAFGC